MTGRGKTRNHPPPPLYVFKQKLCGIAICRPTDHAGARLQFEFRPPVGRHRQTHRQRQPIAMQNQQSRHHAVPHARPQLLFIIFRYLYRNIMLHHRHPANPVRTDKKTHSPVRAGHRLSRLCLGALLSIVQMF